MDCCESCLIVSSDNYFSSFSGKKRREIKKLKEDKLEKRNYITLKSGIIRAFILAHNHTNVFIAEKPKLL